MRFAARKGNDNRVFWLEFRALLRDLSSETCLFGRRDGMERSVLCGFVQSVSRSNKALEPLTRVKVDLDRHQLCTDTTSNEDRQGVVDVSVSIGKNIASTSLSSASSVPASLVPHVF